MNFYQKKYLSYLNYYLLILIRLSIQITKMQHTAKDNCRFCGFTLKKIFIDLGKTPLANSYLKYNQIKKPEKKNSLKGICV